MTIVTDPKDLRFSPTRISFLSSYGQRVIIRGAWLDNDDCYTFYTNPALPRDCEEELKKLVPSDVIIGAFGFDIPKDCSLVSLFKQNFIF